jgi:HEAT repeat protein
MNQQRLSIDQWFELTRHPDPKVRRRAVGSACSCHTKTDYPQVWDCLLAMSRDPDSKVRSYVLHNLVDGSPSSRKDEVVAALERMQQDPDPQLRRRARRLVAYYRRTGIVNAGKAMGL